MKKQVIRKFKRSLTVAAMLGLGMTATINTAQAVELDNNNRLGDAGIFQYYTAQGDWQTFIRIINTSDEALAVKMRFREAANSREVLDYIVFLSPQDMWAGWTGADVGGNGIPGVKTNDTSCLYPKPDNNTQGEGWHTVAPGSFTKYAEFQSRAYTTTGPANDPTLFAYDDGGNVNHTVLERMSEGHIEVIGIAQFSSNSDFGRAVSHGSNGTPFNCDGAIDIYESLADIAGTFDDDQTLEEFVQSVIDSAYAVLAGAVGIDMDNVLAMNGYLVNVDAGMGGGFNPDILRDFWHCDIVHLIACLEEGHAFWDMQLNSLYTATDPDMDSAFDLFIVDNGLNEARDKQKGFEGVQAVTGGVDSVSYELMRASVINEWAASSNPGNTVSDYYTHWVLTFPTKHYYVDLQDDAYEFDDVSPTLTDPDPFGNDAWAPFTNEFNWYGNDSGSGDSCDQYYTYIYNREERISDFASPEPAFPIDLCYETNVVVFNEAYEDLGLASKFSVTIPSGLLPTTVLADGSVVTAERGWAEFDLTGGYYGLYGWRTLEQGQYEGIPHEFEEVYYHRHGLPVTGWMLSVYETNDAVTNHTAINAHAYRIEEHEEEE